MNIVNALNPVNWDKRRLFMALITVIAAVAVMTPLAPIDSLVDEAGATPVSYSGTINFANFPTFGDEDLDMQPTTVSLDDAEVQAGTAIPIRWEWRQGAIRDGTGWRNLTFCSLPITTTTGAAFTINITGGNFDQSNGRIGQSFYVTANNEVCAHVDWLDDWLGCVANLCGDDLFDTFDGWVEAEVIVLDPCTTLQVRGFDESTVSGESKGSLSGGVYNVGAPFPWYTGSPPLPIGQGPWRTIQTNNEGNYDPADNPLQVPIACPPNLPPVCQNLTVNMLPGADRVRLEDYLGQNGSYGVQDGLANSFQAYDVDYDDDPDNNPNTPPPPELLIVGVDTISDVAGATVMHSADNVTQADGNPVGYDYGASSNLGDGTSIAGIEYGALPNETVNQADTSARFEYILPSGSTFTGSDTFSITIRDQYGAETVCNVTVIVPPLPTDSIAVQKRVFDDAGNEVLRDDNELAGWMVFLQSAPGNPAICANVSTFGITDNSGQIIFTDVISQSRDLTYAHDGELGVFDGYGDPASNPAAPCVYDLYEVT